MCMQYRYHSRQLITEQNLVLAIEAYCARKRMSASTFGAMLGRKDLLTRLRKGMSPRLVTVRQLLRLMEGECPRT